MSACEHNNGTPHWDGYSCCDCGSFRTDYAWGIAANQWFKSRTEAEFYKANGRLPEPSADELKARIAALQADNERLTAQLTASEVFEGTFKNHRDELLEQVEALQADNALLVEERDRLRDERDEMADWIRLATSTITEVIGGGSEMFTRRGDAYRIDPRFVANYIETRRGDLHEARVALVKLRKEQRS